MNNLVVRFVASLVFALTWIIVWQEILYASELPGEGFTASVLTLLVVLLQFVVLGYKQASRVLPTRLFFYGLVAGATLLAAIMALPLAWGAPMLTVFKLPIGAYTLSSTTIFDVALFLVVSGGMLYAFTHLKEPRT